MNSTHPPAVLVEYGLHADWAAQPLLDAGFALRGCPFSRLADELDTGRYNALLFGQWDVPHKTKQGEAVIIARLAEAMQRFLEAGGGVFFVMPQRVECVPVEKLAAPLGITFPALEIVGDDMLKADDRRFFGYADRIEPPFADGVSGVWYPARVGWTTATRPLRVDEQLGWRVVARGSPQSHTQRIDVVGYGKPGEDAPGFDAAVPLLAVREGLPGRVAACSIPADFHLYAPHSYALGKRFLSDGFADRPSDILPLTANVLRWLCEPSLQTGRLGGAATDPQVRVPQVPRFPDDPPVRWASRDFPADPQPPRRGLIGARTAYSTGRGTVADYVAKARAAGHDFIVFLESFPALSVTGLEALKADCEAHSTETFLAVPGYTFKDVAGCHYFAYGYQVELPGADLLSPDGTVLSNRPAGEGRATRLDQVHCNLIFGELKTRCRKGSYLHRANPKWIIEHRFNDSFGLVTWEAGRVIDDARDDFRMIMDKGVRLHPTALTFLACPVDFDRALASGWCNTLIEPYADLPDAVLRKHMAPELERWNTFDEAVTRSPRYRFDCWQYGMPFQTATSGPLVRTWTVSVSSRDPDWRAPDHEIPPVADRFRVDASHFRLRFDVTSDVGLAEVLLYDGERLLRRWLCGGARAFGQELDINQAQQMHLLIEARDVRGGTAHTSDFMAYRRDWCEFHCADRNNPLQIGYEKDERGLAYGWSGTRSLTYNNAQWGGTSPWIGKYWFYGDPFYPAPMDPIHDDTAPIDGGVGYAGGGLHLKPQMPQLSPPERGLMVNPLQELISPDVAVCGFICDHGYDPAEPYFQAGEQGWGLYAAYPTRYLHIRRRRTLFRPRPHALTASILQHDIRFKRDLETAGPLPIGWLDDHVEHVFHAADGTRTPFAGKADDPLCIRWRRGEGVVSRLHGTRPAIFINDGADLLLMRADKTGGRVAIHLPADQFPVPRSAVTTLRLLGIGGTVAHTDPDLFDQVRAAMGLTGEPAYRCEVERGEILSTRLTLELDAGDANGVAFTVPQAALPMALPVIVRNLNANWPVALVDRADGRWRPLGVLEGAAYATLETQAREWRVFIGHPVTASHPATVLSLAQTGDDAWALEIHNPTAAAIETAVRRAPLFTCIDFTAATYTLAPGSSRFVTLKGA